MDFSVVPENRELQKQYESIYKYLIDEYTKDLEIKNPREWIYPESIRDENRKNTKIQKSHEEVLAHFLSFKEGEKINLVYLTLDEKIHRFNLAMKVFVDVKLEKSTSKVYYENDNNYKPKPVYRMFVFTGRQRLTNNEYIFVFYYQDEFIYSPYGVFDGKTEKVVQNKVTDVVIRTKPKDFKGFGESVRDWETAAGSLWPNYYPKKQILRFYPKDDERFQRNFQLYEKYKSTKAEYFQHVFGSFDKNPPSRYNTRDGYYYERDDMDEMMHEGEEMGLEEL